MLTHPVAEWLCRFDTLDAPCKRADLLHERACAASKIEHAFVDDQLANTVRALFRLVCIVSQAVLDALDEWLVQKELTAVEVGIVNVIEAIKKYVAAVVALHHTDSVGIAQALRPRPQMS